MNSLGILCQTRKPNPVQKPNFLWGSKKSGTKLIWYIRFGPKSGNPLLYWVALEKELHHEGTFCRNFLLSNQSWGKIGRLLSKLFAAPDSFRSQLDLGCHPSHRLLSHGRCMELGRNPVSKHQIQPEYGDEQADAGRGCRTRLARPNYQVRTRTGKY